MHPPFALNTYWFKANKNKSKYNDKLSYKTQTLEIEFVNILYDNEENYVV